MGKGIVSLVDEGGEVVYTRRYDSVKNRKQILDMWQKQVGPVYQRMAIHIFPNARQDLINSRGKNIVWNGAVHHPKKEPAPVITRLPTVNKSIYGIKDSLY